MPRLAKLEDAPAIAAVQVRSWQAGYRGIFLDEFLDSLDVADRTRWWKHRLESRQGDAFVTERSGDVVGFSTVGSADDPGWGEVVAIYAVPEYWGAGVGHELMEASIHWLEQHGFERALLWVAHLNSRARSFYEREGWRLGRPIRIEKIGGLDVTLVRYERDPLVET